ncbi:MAG: hypothetical protein IJU16_06445, partial [Clostridia bacterium]|nr:hypothetical protein [Clostridia bacterium]
MNYEEFSRAVDAEVEKRALSGEWYQSDRQAVTPPAEQLPDYVTDRLMKMKHLTRSTTGSYESGAVAKTGKSPIAVHTLDPYRTYANGGQYDTTGYVATPTYIETDKETKAFDKNILGKTPEQLLQLSDIRHPQERAAHLQGVIDMAREAYDTAAAKYGDVYDAYTGDRYVSGGSAASAADRIQDAITVVEQAARDIERYALGTIENADRIQYAAKLRQLKKALQQAESNIKAIQSVYQQYGFKDEADFKERWPRIQEALAARELSDEEIQSKIDSLNAQKNDEFGGVQTTTGISYPLGGYQINDPAENEKKKRAAELSEQIALYENEQIRRASEAKEKSDAAARKEQDYQLTLKAFMVDGDAAEKWAQDAVNAEK